MIFAYPKLRQFLRRIKELGPTELFRDWQGGNAFLLRHDVDFDLKPACELATIEDDEGVRSTFFVLTSCRTYNVLNRDNRKLLRQIVNLGHEVGLHFDPTLYADTDLQAAADKEADVLSFAVGEEVRSISLHNPSVHGEFPLFDGYVNAYDPQMFSDQNYISDSRYSFRCKDPFQFIENITTQMIQILLHPMHYSPDGGGYDAVVIRSLEQFINEVHEDFSVNSSYRNQIGDDLVAAFRRKTE